MIDPYQLKTGQILLGLSQEGFDERLVHLEYKVIGLVKIQNEILVWTRVLTGERKNFTYRLLSPKELLYPPRACCKELPGVEWVSSLKIKN